MKAIKITINTLRNKFCLNAVVSTPVTIDITCINIRLIGS